MEKLLGRWLAGDAGVTQESKASLLVRPDRGYRRFGNWSVRQETPVGLENGNRRYRPTESERSACSVKGHADKLVLT